MIDITALTTARDIGRAVIYTPPDGSPREEGTISSWNEEFVFVLYGRNRTAQATYPRDLDWSKT